MPVGHTLPGGDLQARAFQPPLSLYIHLPWCVQKCPYCDFNSHAVKSDLPESAYVAALERDLEMAAAELGPARPLESIFFGGGTPSLFSADAIGRLIDVAAARLPFAADIEITLEANPGTVERGRFADYRHAGVNRISLGVQSFNDAQLRVLGRIHDSTAARTSIEELHAAGLGNFNIDLMFGLPSQPVDDALADVNQAIAADPAHISHYELTLEPNTLFAARPPQGLPDEDLAIEMAAACRARLEEAGFSRYEISAHARGGLQSRHNRNYWAYGDYLGIGAGAHGKWTTPNAEIVRTARHRHPREFLARAGSPGVVAERRLVPPAERAFEYMLNRSRLLEGGHPDDFERLTGLNSEQWLQPGLRQACALGLAERRQDGGWRLTQHGLALLNEVQALFLPGEPNAGAGKP